MACANQSPRGSVGRSPGPSQGFWDFVTIACIIVVLFALCDVKLPSDYFQVYRTIGNLP